MIGKKKKRLTQEVSIADFNFLMYYTVTKAHIMVAFLDFKCNEIVGEGGLLYTTKVFNYSFDSDSLLSKLPGKPIIKTINL